MQRRGWRHRAGVVLCRAHELLVHTLGDTFDESLCMAKRLALLHACGSALGMAVGICFFASSGKCRGINHRLFPTRLWNYSIGCYRIRCS